MKTSARSWTTTSVALAGALLAGAVEARDLTVVAWGGGSQAAARKVYFVPFKEKTGIKLQEFLVRWHRRAADKGEGRQCRMGRRPGRSRRPQCSAATKAYSRSSIGSSLGGEAELSAGGA